MSIVFGSIMLLIFNLVVFVMADIQFNLRIPEELKEKIKEAASQSGRSINAEAQLRLEESFNPSKSISAEKVTSLMDVSERLIKNLTLQNQNSYKMLELVLSEIENPTEAQLEIIKHIKEIEEIQK